jgi:hypothetical protein
VGPQEADAKPWRKVELELVARRGDRRGDCSTARPGALKAARKKRSGGSGRNDDVAFGYGGKKRRMPFSLVANRAYGSKDPPPQGRAMRAGLVGGGGGYGYAHFLEAGAGAAFFFGAGVALDDFTKFLHAGIFLA